MADLQNLLDMGFEKERAEIALKKSGSLERSLEWLEKYQDKSLEDIKADAVEDEEDATETAARIQALESGEPGSIVCDECGKRFRDQDLASYHATKSGHTAFSQSTEVIAPLTEEEKKAKLAQLRERLAAKKAVQSVKDQEDARRNEQIRLKSTRESADAKEELKRKEGIKEAAKKRREKLEDMEYKKRVKEQIEADKAERRRQAEQAKIARGEVPASASAAEPAPAAAPAPAKPKEHNTARLKLEAAGQTIVKSLPAETTLFELAAQVEQETGAPVTGFKTKFPPPKTFEGSVDMGKTLKEAGLVPSSVLVVK